MKDKVYSYLLTIPKGKVVTYKQIAEYLGNPKLARVVGNILHNNPSEEKYPCYKVVNSKGQLSFNFAFGGIEKQKEKLESEGIKVVNYKVDLQKYGIKNMKKVIVIGCPGSGKTTFAEKLNKSTGLPLYYLDAIWHKPDKTHIPREEFDNRIREIFNTDQWIIDGNYGRTIEMRLKECDTVFLFDLPTEVCIQGATDRIGKGRYDLPWLETELDPEFEGFIRDFPKTTLPMIYELIEKYRAGKHIIIFKSRQEADEFLKNFLI